MSTEAVLMSTNNVCFGSKIRKLGKPLQTRVLLYKSGVKGVFIARTCCPDEAKVAIYSFDEAHI